MPLMTSALLCHTICVSVLPGKKPEPVVAAEKLLQEVGKIERAKEEAMKGTAAAFAETGKAKQQEEKST